MLCYLSDLQPPIAGRRIDWGYEQARRFPEIQALRLEEGSNGLLLKIMNRFQMLS